MKWNCKNKIVRFTPPLLILILGLVFILPVVRVRASETSITGEENQNENKPQNNNGEAQTNSKDEPVSEEINWGELKLKGFDDLKSGSKDVRNFSIELVGADPDVYIYTVSHSDRVFGFDEEKESDTKFVGKIFLHNAYPRRTKIYIALAKGKVVTERIFKDVYVDVAVIPQVIYGVDLKALTVYKDMIEFRCLGSPDENGDHVVIQQKKGKKWVELGLYECGIPAGHVIDLKPDTKYSFRLAGVLKGETPEDNVVGPWSKTLTVRTGANEKPVIKSISLSGVKQTYSKEKFVPGYYSGTHWVEARTVAASWYTTANFKVVFKKIPKGSTYAYFLGEYYKIKGNTISGKLKLQGKKKGKKVKVMIPTVRSIYYKSFSLNSKPYTLIIK